MLKIGTVKLGEVPRVVLAVNGESSAVAQASREGVDILEARVDLFERPLTSGSVVNEVKVLKRHERPLIGTIRGRREGGNAKMSDHDRAALYRKIAPLVDAIDIDVRATCLPPVLASARRHHNTVILSYHDFHGTPSESVLTRIMRQATALGSDIVKIAVLAKQERDVLRLLQFTMAHRQHHLVTIAMGRIGSVSRLLFPLAGSLMTYTNVSPSDGQIDVTRLIEDLRFYYPRYHKALITRIGL